MCFIKYGLHTWFAYSICGRTRDLKTVEKHLSSSSRYSKVRWIIPIIELALLIVSDICASKLSDESKVTPIWSLTVSICFINCFLIFTHCVYYIHHFLWRNVQFSCCNIYQDEISIVMWRTDRDWTFSELIDNRTASVKLNMTIQNLARWSWSRSERVCPTRLALRSRHRRYRSRRPYLSVPSPCCLAYCHRKNSDMTTR